MGNLCSSESGPFSQPGRPLGTTPAAPTSASVPAAARVKVGGPPRTLGGAEPGAPTPGSGPDGDDARKKAAAAAEARLQQSKKGGKLQARLNERRGTTDAQALQQASETERRQREVDEGTAALNHS